MTGAHDFALTTLSILIAVAASYTALDLAGRVQAATGRWSGWAWLATAAISMGGGIWSMHFVAMLAFSMPGMEASYDPALTIFSLVLAIAVTGIGFAVVARKETGPVALVLSGIFMGLGIVGMHYTGMAAMRMPLTVNYDVIWVSISVLVAIGASLAALRLAFRRAGLAARAVAAIAMGLAISGMHFAGMRAASFHAHGATDEAQGLASIGQTNLALAVSATTFLILFLALTAAMFDRRFAMLAEKEALALRRREEQFRSLYRKTPLPLHAMNEEGHLEEVSEAWLDLLGYKRDEVIGRPLVNFMTEDSARQRIQVDWPSLLAEGGPMERGYRLVTRQGEILDVVSTSRVERDAEGRFLWAIGGLTDITARKRAEEALRQAQKMEAVGQLTGGVAHDFNNLLAVVLGNLELLRKRLPDDPKMTRMVDNAIEGARRGAALTQRMLSFARKQSLKPEPVIVPDLVRGMEDLLQRSLGPEIRIDTQFPLGLPRAQADAHQLELALLNLAVNARDAMPNGGTITIAAREEHLGKGQVQGLAAGRYICLSVKDTGEGMDKATLQRAREPFFTTKGVGKGTGLGLSMVHGFAEQSGGTLTLDSQVGRGTTAEIWLPIAARETGSGKSEDNKGATAPATLRRLGVLVVDDDALVLANTAAMLEDLGHTVLQATSGIEGLRLIDQTAGINIVVADYAMPHMTGIELAAAIRLKRPDLPVLLATGYAELANGITPEIPRLSKPFGQLELAQALESLVRHDEARGNVVPITRPLLRE